MHNLRARLPGKGLEPIARGSTQVTRVARSTGGLIALLAVIALIAGCGAASSTSKNTTTPITFGVAAAFTGPTSYDGAIFGTAVKIACGAINKAGGVLGHRCSMDAINTLGDAADGALAVRKAFATDQNLEAVLGLSTGEATTEVPIVIANHAVAFSIAGNQTLFNNSKLAPYLYMDQPPDSQTGVALALAAVKEGCNRPALVFQTGPDAAPAAAGTDAALHNVGVTPTANISLPQGLPSYSSVASQVVASHPQCLVTEIDDPASAGTFFGDMATALGGKYSLKTISDDVATAGPWVKAVGNAIGQSALTGDFQIVQPATPPTTPGSKFVAAQWPKYHSGVPVTASFSEPLYDSAILAALAMDQTHSLSASKWSPDVAKIAAGEPGGTTVYTYAEGVKALKAGHAIHYVGAIGNMHWDSEHSQTLPQAAYGLLAGGALGTKAIITIGGRQIASASKGVAKSIQ